MCAKFATTLCPARPTNGLVPFSDWEAFDGLLLMVYFGTDTYDKIEGSAVMVAPGVALSAGHVMTDWIAAVTQGKAGCMLTGFVKGGQVYWRAVGVRVDAATDLAIISVELAGAPEKSPPIRLAHLSTRTSAVGESLMFCGYRGAEPKFEHGGKDIELTATAYVSTGKINAIHAAGRDRVRYPWPCYEVDCVIDGGMSGGPVFDSQGFLVGVAGGGFDVFVDGKTKAVGPSYAWHAWPCLLRPFKPVWPKAKHSGVTSLLEMRRELCAIERPEALKGDQSLGDGNRGMVYEAWSKR
jgi:hypothetical protein